MTKRLEEELGLPPIEEVRIPDEIEETLPTVEESQEEIALVQGKLDMTERIDGSLPAVIGLEELDREMDEYATKAMNTFEDLCDLGKNVEDRHAAPIFDSASKMLTAALTAKQHKMDKKLKKSIDIAYQRIKTFHSKQKHISFKYKTRFSTFL